MDDRIGLPEAMTEIMPSPAAENTPTALEIATSPAEAARAPEAAPGVFGKLVRGDDDIVGLVAYALYKQNKIDWVRAFERERGRAPSEAEFGAYIVGENTARRVATYRFLAESTIGRATGVRRPGVARHPAVSATLNVLYGLFGVMAVAALIVLLRFFISLR